MERQKSHFRKKKSHVYRHREGENPGVSRATGNGVWQGSGEGKGKKFNGRCLLLLLFYLHSSEQLLKDFEEERQDCISCSQTITGTKWE